MESPYEGKSEIELSVTINTEEKWIYIGLENGAGAEYNFETIEELSDKFKFYINNYFSDLIKNNNEIEK